MVFFRNIYCTLFSFFNKRIDGDCVVATFKALMLLTFSQFMALKIFQNFLFALGIMSQSYDSRTIDVSVFIVLSIINLMIIEKKGRTLKGLFVIGYFALITLVFALSIYIVNQKNIGIQPG